MEQHSINCKCTIEWLSKTGIVTKTVKALNASLKIVRNEFREIFLTIESKIVNQKLLLKGVVIHKKFVHEGKATIKFPEIFINVFLFNAAPSHLVAFLKIMFIKLSSSASSPKTSIRNKLLSNKLQNIQGVSPVNVKDVNRVKSSKETISSQKRSCSNGDQPQQPNKKSCLYPSSALTDEQKQILDAVLLGANVFFTGGAGTGKSFLLQFILNSLQPDVTVATASTGSAACIIGGVTLHSFAGIGIGEGTFERCLTLASRHSVKQCWKRCKHLIIDEISMVNASYFEKIEWVARNVRKNDRPFGGIQLVVCGDFLQLPPVNKDKDTFCFLSECWDKMSFKTFYLKQVHRQDDPNFISILNSVRLGSLTPSMEEQLQRTETQSIEKEGIHATRLCCYTKEAKEINEFKLAKLTGESKIFEAIDSSKLVTNLLDDCTPVEKCITLKEGAQVMLLKNINVSLGLVNGARGIVEKFSNGQPVVKFLSGKSYSIKHEKWVVKAANGAAHTRVQIPLRLAWAFSIHKSQGLTLDCVEMSLDNTFEAGQAYVALSRAKNLKSIRVIAFHPRQVWANPDALSFYKKLANYHQEFIPIGKKKKSQKRLFPTY